MTLTIPTELEHVLSVRAQQRRISLEELVQEALTWYIGIDALTIDELTAWQEVRDEAIQCVEERPT